MLIEICTLNIYARIRKVINFYRIKEKNWKKKFLWGLTTPHFCPFAPSPPLYWKYFTYFVILLYITFYFLSIFFIDFFFTMLCYHKMLSHPNYLTLNILHLYFPVCYFIPQLFFITYIYAKTCCIFIHTLFYTIFNILS